MAQGTEEKGVMCLIITSGDPLENLDSLHAPLASADTEHVALKEYTASHGVTARTLLSFKEGKLLGALDFAL